MEKHMMATKAIHKLGDISRDTPDLCFINDKDDDNYIGSWVYGFGFIKVKFPKETTRDLTPDEIKEYNGKYMAINNTPVGPIKIKGYKCTSS